MNKSKRIVTFSEQVPGEDRVIDGCWGGASALSLTAEPVEVLSVIDTEDGEPVEFTLTDGAVHRLDGQQWAEGDGQFDDNGRFHVTYRVS